MISYKPFWNTLREKNISTYMLIEKKHISPSTLQRLRKNENLQASTLDDLCQALECRIEDIIEILPNGAEVVFNHSQTEQQKKQQAENTKKRLDAYTELVTQHIHAKKPGD